MVFSIQKKVSGLLKHPPKKAGGRKKKAPDLGETQVRSP